MEVAAADREGNALESTWPSEQGGRSRRDVTIHCYWNPDKGPVPGAQNSRGGPWRWDASSTCLSILPFSSCTTVLTLLGTMWEEVSGRDWKRKDDREVCLSWHQTGDLLRPAPVALWQRRANGLKKRGGIRPADLETGWM